MGSRLKIPALLMDLSSSEADAALRALQDSPPGSLTVYVLPEASSLLPQVGRQPAVPASVGCCSSGAGYNGGNPQFSTFPVLLACSLGFSDVKDLAVKP